MQKRSGSSEEKAVEASSVSAICCGSPSRQGDSRDVETDLGGLWSTQEGQKSCLSFTGSKSSSYAVGEDSRSVSVSNLKQSSELNESRVFVAAATATSSGRVGMSFFHKVVLWWMRWKVSSNNSGIFLGIWPRVALERPL
jgi:hypothetical protein